MTFRSALAEFKQSRSTSCEIRIAVPQGHESLCIELQIGGDTPHTFLPAEDNDPELLRELASFLATEFEAEAERTQLT